MVLPMLTTALLLSLACAPNIGDDTASLGDVAPKGVHPGGVTFDPSEAWLPASPVAPVALTVAGRAHVIASYCDDGIVVIAPEWIVDGSVVALGRVPGYPLADGDHTCTLITPIGRLTIPVVVE